MMIMIEPKVLEIDSGSSSDVTPAPACSTQHRKKK